MQIEQIHIPDIPALKSVFKADISTSTWQSITDFFEKYWEWVVGILITMFVIYIVFSPKNKKEESQTIPPQPPDSINAQNSF